MIKTIKKEIIVVIILCAVIAAKISSKIIINNRFIANYPEKDQEYRLVLLTVLNLYEPYIAHYNYGNYYYQKEQYEDAAKKYRKALEYDIPLNRVCSVEINLSLSLMKQAEELKETDSSKSLELLKPQYGQLMIF